ncbi:MAG: alpha/beta hydrolase-fold protein [Blastocatellia bacterium]
MLLRELAGGGNAFPSGGLTVITRRRFCAISGGVLVSSAAGACRFADETREGNDGRLTARPRENVEASAKLERALGLDPARDAFLQLPMTATRAPMPLVVLFHGAGQSAEWMLHRLGSAADEAAVAVLAPNSRASSWDAIRDGFGPDVSFLNRALERVFESVTIDPTRIAAGGFSDGATYALSLGLINGDLFSRVVAFSPGFLVAGTARGTPRFFISHGTGDRILPIDRCSRRIVRGLRERGYDVTFREFDGGHEVPDDIALEGMRCVAGGSTAEQPRASHWTGLEYESRT